METKIKFFMRFLFSLIFIFQSLFLFAQKNIEKAEDSYKKGHYFNAIQDYLKDFEKTKELDIKLDLTFKIANSYYLINKYPEAEKWFSKAISGNHKDTLIYLYYADCLKSQGKYDQALEYYKKFKSFRPYDTRPQKAIDIIITAKSWMEKPSPFVVKVDSNLSTTFDEFSIVYNDSKYTKYIVSSNRTGVTGKLIDKIYGGNCSDLFSIQGGKKKSDYVVTNALGDGVNTEFSEFAPSLNGKLNTMYYSRYNEDVSPDYVMYMTAKQGNTFGFSDPLKIPKLKEETYIAGATISADELLMIFSADIPGGYGGKDLYYVTRRRDNGQWLTEPINLGSEINTPQDEIYPYLKNDGSLYFASNGQPSMGGFDIFVAKAKESTKYSNPVNLKSPINSPFDDYGIIFQENVDKGLFISNRTGGIGGYDVYTFQLPSITLKGSVIDKNSNAPIANATVKISEIKGGSFEVKTNDKGVFVFKNSILKPSKQYNIIVSKVENGKIIYPDQTKLITIDNYKNDAEVKVNFEL